MLNKKIGPKMGHNQEKQLPEGLTKRRLEVLNILANKGVEIGHIANMLGIRYDTVTRHLNEAREALGARTNHEAIKFCVIEGWIKYE